MAIDWPTSPAVGDFYPAVATRQWKWNGEGWERTINGGQVAAYFVSFINVETFFFVLPFTASGAFTSFTYL